MGQKILLPYWKQLEKREKWSMFLKKSWLELSILKNTASAVFFFTQKRFDDITKSSKSQPRKDNYARKK